MLTFHSGTIHWSVNEFVKFTNSALILSNTMVLISDGNSEHVAHACRKKCVL